MALTRDQLVNARPPLPRETVAVPELGGEIILQGLSGTARDAFEQGMIVGKGKKRDINLKNLRARLLVLSIVDESGARIFTDADQGIVGAWPAAVVDPLYAKAKALSGISDSDEDELGEPTPNGT